MREGQRRFLEGAERWLGPVLFAGSLVLYLSTLCRTPFPGESARLVVQHSGFDPFPPMSHLLFNYVARLLAAIPWGSVALKLSLVSALCGAAAVWLVYRLTAWVPHNRTAEEVESRFPTAPVQTVSGFVAAVFFAVCAPIWVASTRAYTAMFDLALLLSAAALLVRFHQTGRARWLYGFAVVYGLGTTEMATFIVLAPIFALATMLLMWKAGLRGFRSYATVLLLFMAGLVVYLAAAREYQLSPAYAWREFKSYGQVVWYLWRDQYRAIRFGLPQVGWLMVFLVTTLPWLIVIASPKRAMTRSSILGSNLLHGLLAALAVLIMFNVRVAPWAILKLGPLLVTPYALTAMWAGYLAGYWFIFTSQYSRFQPKARAAMRTAVRNIYLPVLAAVLVGGTWANFRWVDSRPARPAWQFAQEVVGRLEGRRWLVSSGVLDDLVRLAACEQGVAVNILDTRQGAAKPYLRYLASLFDDARLKGLAQAGLGPLLNEWLADWPAVDREVAILAAPDLWFSAGYTPVPDRVLFGGTTNAAAVDSEALFREQDEFWTRFRASSGDPAKAGLLAPWNAWILGHVSKVANNTGVFLEDVGKNDLAFQAYQQARRLDTNNLSALLNMLSLAQRESLPERAAIENEYEGFLRRLRTKLNLWSLAYNYGYVRYAEVFAERGMAWAMSGKPNIAISEMQRALSLGANRQKVGLAIASFYLMQQKGGESEQAFLDVLKGEPDNVVALLGLTRATMQKGEYETARGYLARLRELNAPAVVVSLEEAVLESLSGNTEAAKGILNKLVEEDQGNLRAWTLLAVIASSEKDPKELDRCLAVLKSRATGSPGVLALLAQLAMAEGNLKAAREHLNSLLAIQPAHVQALEWLLQVDVAEGDRSAAEFHVERLLGADPKNAFGNLVLGSMQYARQEYELAEASYRTSLASQRSVQALNDLAYILQLKGRYDEAALLAREAVEKGEGNAAAWDTLGVIAMKQKQVETAQAALQKALTLVPDNPHFILHMAQLYDAKGMKSEALRLADPLLARASEMEPDAYEELRELMKKLRAGG